jgi:hypothetical protein
MQESLNGAQHWLRMVDEANVLPAAFYFMPPGAMGSHHWHGIGYRPLIAVGITPNPLK